MINNKLKIYDSKTEFIVFRYPQANQDLSGLFVIVGESIIQQYSKVRNYFISSSVLMMILVMFAGLHTFI